MNKIKEFISDFSTAIDELTDDVLKVWHIL